MLNTIQDILCELGMKARKYATIGNHYFFTKKSTGIKLSNIEAVDIDTDEDWKFAELLYKTLQLKY